MKEYEIDNPRRVFADIDEKGNEWLGIDIHGCELESCDRIWIRCWRPKRGGYPSPQRPANLAGETILRLPYCPERILRREPGADQKPDNDPGVVEFGLDVRNINIEPNKKDLSKIQVLLIPCSTLEAKVPGFEEGSLLE